MKILARRGEFLSYWESHIGKLPKLIGSLCIILHCLKEVLEERQSQEISLETFLSALQLTEYYTLHAQRCYESVESMELAAARKILDLIQQGKLTTRFKAADIHGRNLGGLRNSPLVKNALLLLQGRYGLKTVKRLFAVFMTSLFKHKMNEVV